FREIMVLIGVDSGIAGGDLGPRPGRLVGLYRAPLELDLCRGAGGIAVLHQESTSDGTRDSVDGCGDRAVVVGEQVARPFPWVGADPELEIRSVGRRLRQVEAHSKPLV